MKIKINHITDQSDAHTPRLHKLARLDYNDYQIDTLPEDYINWVYDLLIKGEALIKLGKDEKKDYRASIIIESMYVCILDALTFTKSKDEKVELIKLAKLNKSKFLPKELKHFGEKYSGLWTVRDLTCPPKVVPIVMLQIWYNLVIKEEGRCDQGNTVQRR